MKKIEPPEGWTKIGTEFEQQIAAYQRRRDGLVLSIEKATTTDKYAVSFLPRNFQQDNQVIQSYGDSGYLYSGNSREDAFEKAKEWMETNKN
jgi:hypothetical protein